MLKRSNSKFSLAMFLGIALSVVTQADDIREWPTRDGVNLEPAKQRFIELFENEPDNLNYLSKDFEDCLLDASKVSKLSNVNEEAVLGPYASNEQVEVDVDLDINTLNVSSSAAGCAALRNTPLEQVPAAKFRQYQVPSAFKYSFLVYADYETDLEMTIEVKGAGDHKSETHSEIVSYIFFEQPLTPIDKAYPKEVISIVDMTMGDIQVKSYSLSLSSYKAVIEGIGSLTLSRSNTKGALANAVHIVEKQKGLDRIQMIGNHTLISILDGKMHGLMVSDNYLYASDKTQDPYMYTCYDMGDKFNVFKKLANNTCTKVGDSQIGMSDVYVDQIYKMQLDSKKRIAEIHRKSAERTQARALANKKREETDYVPAFQEQRRLKEETAKKEKEHKFLNKQTQAKCKLLNDNWAYLGASCKDGLASGQGSAVDRQGLKFEGTIKAGSRIKGDIHQNGQMIFSGDFKNDKPDGGAICLFEGEYEECRFFRGKRIDTLYKIRKENAKNLTKMEKIQQENAMAASQGNHADNGGDSSVMVDALEQEATKRAASFIFDQLF